MSSEVVTPIDGPDFDSTDQKGSKERKIERQVEAWFKKIDKAHGERKNFKQIAKRACKAYNLSEVESEDEGDVAGIYYPLLWANVQVIRGSLYTATPTPDVRRRDGRREPLFRAISMMMDRGIRAFIDMHDFDGVINRTLTDNLVPGIGQIRVNYDADITEMPINDQNTGEPMLDEETGEPMTMPEVKNEKVFTEHVPWDQFLYDPCIDWYDCQWVDFIHYLDRYDIVDQFGFDPKTAKLMGETQMKQGKQLYEVHEVWCKRTKKIYFLMRGKKTPIATKEDLFNFKNFFPCPKPFLANIGTKGFQPIPDYAFYETQANQINRLTQRINNLTATGTVARGLYDASIGEELSSIAMSDDLEYVPVAGLWNKLEAAGGTGGMWDRVVADFPIKNAADVIGILQQQRESELTHVYQITGISDIMRGASKASETAKAQQIKSQASSSRASIRKQGFNFFIREVIELMSEMAANHLQPETWQEITGIQMTDELDEALHDSLLMQYTVDIETDSTIALDDQGQKEAMMEAVNVTTNTIGTLLPMMQQGLPGDVVQQVIMAAMKPFKETRNFEDAVSQITSTQQQTQQLQQQIQEGGQQIEDLTKQLEEAQAELDKVDEFKNETDRIETVAEAQRDGAQTRRLDALATEDFAKAGTEPQRRETLDAQGELYEAQAEEIRSGRNRTGAD